MNRKVVQQGPSTLMVSLPIKWVKENHIQKGDDVDVSEENGRLVLAINKKNEFVRKEFSEHDLGVLNKYFVNYAYHKGYDEVLLCFDSDISDELEKRVKDLIGFEVVEKKKNSLLLKALVHINEQEFETVLKKLFQVTLVIGDLILENKLAEAQQMEKENNKYCDLCIRILFKNKYKYPENGFALFGLLRELEQIGDLYRHIAGNYDSSLQPIFEQIHAYFRLYYEIYYHYDAVKVQKFFVEKERLLQLLNDKEKTAAVIYLSSLVQGIYDLKGLLFLQKV